ncbi:MAG: hypothetical protein AABX70_01070 [Nanoarchaeota archaeon]
MNLAEQAYQELFPGKEADRAFSIYYTDHFKAYNANVRYTRDKMEFRLSRKWKTISEEIQIGLLQSLMAKVYKLKKKTLNMELYAKYLHNLSEYSPVTEKDPVLEASFLRLNERYFNGLLNQPNLVWGKNSFRKLGHYEYASDTICLSTVLQEEPCLIDYVLYHEMLHKKHKFHTTAQRSMHHSAAFKKDEKKYENALEWERKLNEYLRKKRRKKWLFW